MGAANLIFLPFGNRYMGFLHQIDLNKERHMEIVLSQGKATEQALPLSTP